MTHALNRADRRGDRRSARRLVRTGPASPGQPGRRRPLFFALLIAAFAAALATLVPGVAHAEGEQVRGTLTTSLSGPIEGVTITVETASGEEVDSVETDEARAVRDRPPGAGRVRRQPGRQVAARGGLGRIRGRQPDGDGRDRPPAPGELRPTPTARRGARAGSSRSSCSSTGSVSACSSPWVPSACP